MKKYFLVSVPDNIYSEKLDLFLQEKLKFDLSSTGCGTTEFIIENKPKKFKDIIVRNFGKITYEEIQTRRIVGDK